MRKSLLIGGSILGSALALPLVAYAAMDMGGMGPMATVTKAEATAKVQEMFTKLDVNKDGSVTQAEVKTAMDARRAERRGKMFERMDTNKDGSISRAEFDTAHSGPGMKHRGHDSDDHGREDAPPPAGATGPGASPPVAMGGHDGHRGPGHHRMGMKGGMMGGMGGKMFEMADANKDGKVTLKEATSASLAHFDKVDANKDGQLTPEERRAFRDKMRSEWRAKPTV